MVPPGAAGKALDALPGNPGMDVSVPGAGGKELSAGNPGADGDPTGGNPPELELSAGRAGRLELDAPAGGKAGKPELSEGNPGAAGGRLSVPELSEGRAGSPGFEYPVVPGIGGVELSLVKGGKAGDPLDGIVELSAPNCGGAVPLSCPPGKGGNPPLVGAALAIGAVLELELSVGKGGNPFAEPAPDADEMLEPVDATPLSGKGGRLEPLETVVSSLGSGGRADWLTAAALPFV